MCTCARWKYSIIGRPHTVGVELTKIDIVVICLTYYTHYIIILRYIIVCIVRTFRTDCVMSNDWWSLCVCEMLFVHRFTRAFCIYNIYYVNNIYCLPLALFRRLPWKSDNNSCLTAAENIYLLHSHQADIPGYLV